VHRQSIFWIVSPQCTRYLKNKIHDAHRFIFNFYCISQPILQYNYSFENNTEHNNEWVDWFQFSSDPDWFQLQHVQSTWNSFFKYLFSVISISNIIGQETKSTNLVFFFNNLAPAISGPYLTVSATILNQFYKHSCPPRPMQSCFTSLTHIHIVDQIKLN
jgi:hypothetical protein